ncbi:MAG: LacI family DNA-binding transcriptional regulator [Anaerolineales bacterium]|nr:LacI family DNA-binding transcriptional regulator [Anaerolineales bacterium]
MPATLKDIAQLSGFSITTISRALGGYSDVSPKTRQRIIEIANQIGYEPNLVARQLRQQQTHTIGFIIPEDTFSDGFFSQLLMGIGHAAAQYHNDVLISTQLPDNEELAAYRRIAGGNRVDGMVVARTRQNDPRITYLESIGLPYVVSGRLAPDEVSDFPYIDVDSQDGVRKAVIHLTERGHRHIALILPPQEMAYTAYRLLGYCLGLDDANIPYRDEYVVTGNLEHSGGYEQTHYLLANFPAITAIVACNDHMALGTMEAIRERGLTVGKDIAVIGFDDIVSAGIATPPLTTIRQPIFEIGERLIQMLIQIIQNQPPKEQQVLLPTTLVIRQTT